MKADGGQQCNSQPVMGAAKAGGGGGGNGSSDGSGDDGDNGGDSDGNDDNDDDKDDDDNDDNDDDDDLRWECQIFECQKNGRIDRHVCVGPTCRQHVANMSTDMSAT